jgi:hypothetical protein
MDNSDQKACRRLLKRDIVRATAASFLLGISVCMLTLHVMRKSWSEVITWILISSMFVFGTVNAVSAIWKSASPEATTHQ